MLTDEQSVALTDEQRGTLAYLRGIAKETGGRIEVGMEDGLTWVTEEFGEDRDNEKVMWILREDGVLDLL